MRMVKDAFKVAIAARSPKILVIFAINMIANRIGSDFRIRRFSEVRVRLYGAIFYVSSWDGLLAVRPGNEPKVHAEIQAVAEGMSPGVFVDIGAHIGRYCFEFAKYFEKTIAFEPTSATFEHLQATWENNPSKDKISIQKAGISNSSGEAEFLISEDESQNSFVRDTTTRYLGSETVTLRTLDEELSAGEKAKLSLLLIDVEGAESKVLEGAKETLQSGSPTIVIELLDQAARDRCDRVLADLGYSGIQLDRSNWKYVRDIRNV